MKKIIYIFILIFFCSDLLACNIKFRNFGSSPDSLKINLTPLIIKDPIGGMDIVMPISSLCPQNKELFGTIVSLNYINNELVQIRFERFNQNDRALMELAILRYGNFKRSLGLDKNKWQGTHTWENSSDIINYLATFAQGGNSEKLIITSKTHLNKISEHFVNKEKWKK